MEETKKNYTELAREILYHLKKLGLCTNQLLESMRAEEKISIDEPIKEEIEGFCGESDSSIDNSESVDDSEDDYEWDELDLGEFDISYFSYGGNEPEDDEYEDEVFVEDEEEEYAEDMEDEEYEDEVFAEDEEEELAEDMEDEEYEDEVFVEDEEEEFAEDMEDEDYVEWYYPDSEDEAINNEEVK